MAGRGGSENLIIQTAFVGDLLLGIPLFKQMRRLRPDDKITLFCRKGLGDFLVRSGLVDEAVEADKSSPESWAAATSQLKSRRFDWLICPHQSIRSSLLVASLKAELKVGYRKGLLGLVFNRRVERPMVLPEAIRQLALLAPLDGVWRERLSEFRRVQVFDGGQKSEGALTEVPGWAEMSVENFRMIRASRARGDVNGDELSPKARSLALELGLGAKPLVMLAPSSVWRTKMWKSDGFAEVARVFVKCGYQVLIMGSPEEKAVCEHIAQRAPGAVSIAGRTGLYESTELLALAELLVCNDSGAMHMAAAAETPTVAIFGPTVLELGYRPWQNSAKVVQIPRTHLPCRPCGKHGAQSCPLQTHECMEKISAQSVLTAASAFVKVPASME